MISLIKGTGKTRTIVGSIAEIISSSNNCVLVCVNSNAACDEIVKRLLEVVPRKSIFRMYAKSFKVNDVSDNIKEASNLVENQIKFPSLAYLYKFRVVVCTIITAGSLVRARSKDTSFDSSHFSHVFIDEAACVQEPISMIAIAGMYVGKKNNIHQIY